MTEPLTDAAALALYDAVWPGRIAGDEDAHLADCIRVVIAAPNLGEACDEWQPEDDDEVNRLRALRRLAGIDDDAELVERMAKAACEAYHGPQWEDRSAYDEHIHVLEPWRRAARAAIEAYRESEGND